MYEDVFGIIIPQCLICHKTKPNQTNLEIPEDYMRLIF